MHQPYYKNILTQETSVPWVRLHGIKDYLDMVQMLENYPNVRMTFNLVPSLLEQVEDFIEHRVKDRYLELSYKPAASLDPLEKGFLLTRFFSINPDTCIAMHPRYYELYLKHKAHKEFNTQDYLDLQVWFNFAWYDPMFRNTIPELRALKAKARFFSEDDKRVVLDSQMGILKQIIPAYKKFMASGQIEVILSPYYHPILPLLYNTTVAKEAKLKAVLPRIQFSHPADAKAQIDEAVSYYESRFGSRPVGMWPSEEAVSQHILDFISASGIKWIVADEAILFRSLKHKRRDTHLLYHPHLLHTEKEKLFIVFRDRNLSDLIGFSYNRWSAHDAVVDFMKHLENIAVSFKNTDVLVTVALDGENAWEYYKNDGHNFLELLYQNINDSKFVKTTTVPEYLKSHEPTDKIDHLSAGSWIYGDFEKWLGSPKKNKAWEYLEIARVDFEKNKVFLEPEKLALAEKQMLILEGSDWFWWYGDDDTGDFDRLYRMHLSNLYSIMGKEIPPYCKEPI